ncbi:MAG: vWA domain-containing protein [Myxococcota bacterium]|jgi:hypothetical protein|nr:vWA domain-containing protein [Myxococcota bacterium]
MRKSDGGLLQSRACASQYLRVLAGLSAIAFLLVWASLSLAAGEFMPKRSRAKIDWVDVSDAPVVRIFATFLDAKSLPVSPDKIKAAYVACNEKELEVKTEIKTFADMALPMDIALVVPISARFRQEEIKQLQEGLGAIIEQTRDIDRVAAFVDDGRGIARSGLVAAADAAALVSSTKPLGGGAFLYSGLRHAIDTLKQDGRSDARRVIIVATDGFDTEIITPKDVRSQIMTLYREAKDEGIAVQIIMYKPIISDLIPFFEGMSRKTGGTYRETSSPSGILRMVKFAWGEVYGQLVIEFEQPDVEKGDACSYSLLLEREFGAQVSTRAFSAVEFEEIQFNWIRFAIIAGIVLLLLLIIVIVIVVLVKRRRRKKKAAEAAQPKPSVCPKCNRSMLPEWESCMFCARDAEAGAAKPAAAGGAAKAGAQKADAKGDAKAEKNKKEEEVVCKSCGRTMMPGWKECLFCKAGIGGAGAAAAGGGAAAAKPAAAAAKADAKGLRICPKCKRPMKEHWDICLFCEAER